MNIDTYEASAAAERMNRYGAEGRPFLFLVDYAMRECVVEPLEEIDPERLLYAIGSRTNAAARKRETLPEWVWEPRFCPQEEYDRAFDTVMRQLRAGNSYLANLTYATPVRCNLSLPAIFELTEARYKIGLADRFVCFSPETFVRIGSDGTIASFPMKGTIDAGLPDAERRILNDPKEAAEHATIVDLIRNDLSRVAAGVKVARYRYVDRIRTHCGDLLQVSSEIRGQLSPDWHGRIGSVLFKLLPAGSVTGAPKPRTLEIIAEAETYDRGYYTGICGLFDGEKLDSGVMIRFLEQPVGGAEGEYLFKSGGGITHRSDRGAEYEEMKKKVYVPLRRNDLDR
ncbi:aminodeoxychorismate synthase component I [uncultured Rikenella sp.]|uniref:aminodeoxychorismate synthase component I n=1 Tax=uncultured Rikenella sp. TaxID=368003 RepID=UPI0026262E50|nr:aminodeoxychorismate synthase component I [uncultured Rikenella sp.]